MPALRSRQPSCRRPTIAKFHNIIFPSIFAGLRGRLTALGWRYEDCGDIEPHTPTGADPAGETSAKNAYSVLETNRRLHEVTHREAEKGNFVLTLGGDHSVAMGSIAGIMRARPELSVLWVDAHADINSPDGSPSGNMHGMPVAFLSKLLQLQQFPGSEWLEGVPTLDPQRIAYVALRDVDAYERKQIAKLNIKAFSMRDLDKYGVGRVM